MILRDTAERLGITKYPAEMDRLYAELPATSEPVCDLSVLDSLQQEYNIFGKYYNVVRENAIALNADAGLSTWVRVAIAYTKGKMPEECRNIPVPKPDGTDLTSLLPLYIHIPLIPGAMADYKRRGFSEAEIDKLMKSYEDGLRVVEKTTGRAGINTLYFGWLLRFSKAMIFYAGGFEVEVRKLPDTTVYLKNRENGKVIPVMTGGEFHRSGQQRLGGKGFEDPEGAFTAKYYEDEENFYGNPCIDLAVRSEIYTFPKSQWELLAAPGDKCLGIHIPKGTDISHDAVDKAIEIARQIVRNSYTEYNAQYVYCSSWMLDPMIADILGPDSKLSAFGLRFIRYPSMCNGLIASYYAFGGFFEKIEDMPEETRLQRGMKQRFLNGEFNKLYNGLII